MVDGEIMFPNAIGGLLSRSSGVIRDMLDRARQDTGIPNRQCRTTFATLYDGDPKDRQAILGHHSKQFTMRVYQKPIAARQPASIEELDSRLAGKVVENAQKNGRAHDILQFAPIARKKRRYMQRQLCCNIGMIQVVAAIIERDGRVLIGRRKPEQSHPLQWEFPGGKVEPGETPEQALARELAEELAVLEVEGREITRQEFTYPGKDPIELIFYRVESFTGEPENRVFHEMRWERRSALPAFDFVEGDREFLCRFAREG